MSIVYKVTPVLRTKFKEPFGTLIKGEFAETVGTFKELIEKEKPSRLISVGDVVSSNLHKSKIHPQLTIIDNKFLRKEAAPEGPPARSPPACRGPRGRTVRRRGSRGRRKNQRTGA